jgi:hypothetical protein
MIMSGQEEGVISWIVADRTATIGERGIIRPASWDPKRAYVFQILALEQWRVTFYVFGGSHANGRDQKQE